MQRRAFVAGMLAMTAAPRAAPAQPPRKLSRVGYLGDGPRAERLGINLEPFREGLRELGYVEGQNVVIVERWTEGRAERFELRVNLKTAKALNLTIPPSLLLRADQIID